MVTSYLGEDKIKQRTRFLDLMILQGNNLVCNRQCFSTLGKKKEKSWTIEVLEDVYPTRRGRNGQGS